MTREPSLRRRGTAAQAGNETDYQAAHVSRELTTA